MIRVSDRSLKQELVDCAALSMDVNTVLSDEADSHTSHHSEKTYRPIGLCIQQINNSIIILLLRNILN